MRCYSGSPARGGKSYATATARGGWKRRGAGANGCAPGEAVALVTITAEIIDLLVRTRWVDERDACDRAEVGMAIAALLAMMGG
jgi:hypothetical protein